ncbi:hypothetical protein RKD48_007974 [Streptomyces ambofaciens]
MKVADAEGVEVFVEGELAAAEADEEPEDAE